MKEKIAERKRAKGEYIEPSEEVVSTQKIEEMPIAVAKQQKKISSSYRSRPQFRFSGSVDPVDPAEKSFRDASTKQSNHVSVNNIRVKKTRYSKPFPKASFPQGYSNESVKGSSAHQQVEKKSSPAKFSSQFKPRSHRKGA